jgi:hypothetical protein
MSLNDVDYVAAIILSFSSATCLAIRKAVLFKVSTSSSLPMLLSLFLWPKYFKKK